MVELMELKQDILRVLQSTQIVKNQLKQIMTSNLRSLRVIVIASQNTMMDWKNKMEEARALLHENEARLVLFNTVCGEDVVRRLSVPEHLLLNNHKFYERTVKSSEEGLSIWDTSEYKIKLVESLYLKLLLKLSIVTLSHHAHG
jgi:hypothetical protein